jgi:hypothetical protein
MSLIVRIRFAISAPDFQDEKEIIFQSSLHSIKRLEISGGGGRVGGELENLSLFNFLKTRGDLDS